MIEEVIKELGDMVKTVTPIASEPFEAPSGDGKVMVIRDGYKPHAMPGGRKNQRQHVFGDIASLAEWLTREVAEERRKNVDLLVAEKEIKALVDPTKVGTDAVTCPLVFHPTFVAWQSALKASFTQKEFHAFIRGQVDTFAGNAGQTLANEITKINLISGGKLTMELDALGYHRVHGGTATASIDAALPPRFQILIPVLLGVRDDVNTEAKYVIDVFLSVDVDEDDGEKDAVLFSMTAPMLDLVLYNARLDAVKYLKRLAVGFDVMLGQAQTKEVPA